MVQGNLDNQKRSFFEPIRFFIEPKIPLLTKKVLYCTKSSSVSHFRNFFDSLKNLKGFSWEDNFKTIFLKYYIYNKHDTS